MRRARWLWLVTAAVLLFDVLRGRRRGAIRLARPHRSVGVDGRPSDGTVRAGGVMWPAGQVSAADDPRRVDDLRRDYEAVLASGLDRFFEPRRRDCPLCGSTDLAVKIRTTDLQHGKPGEFVLEVCGACGHIFQNPRLSPEGRDFYERGVDGRPDDTSLDGALGTRHDAHRSRARMVEGHAEPQRWLDVGSGEGHFCMVAREVWPETRFEAVDHRDAIERAERRQWVDDAHRGVFCDIADGLPSRYDVVSMHHYLEHARDPMAEIDAARRVLVPGGHLLIELADPSSPFGRVLGRHWVPWYQPQHQHLLSVENLEWALGERGFTPIVQHHSEAHQPVDLAGAVFLFLNRIAPPTDVPWRASATTRQRVWRTLVFAAGAPLLAGALLLDHLLAVVVRRRGRSNTYRVLARLDEVRVSPDAPPVIDLRESVTV